MLQVYFVENSSISNNLPSSREQQYLIPVNGLAEQTKSLGHSSLT